MRTIERQDLEDFRAVARAYFESSMRPLVEEAEEAGRPPRGFVSSVAKAGYTGIRYPSALGGGDGNLLTECIWIEEAARVCCGLTSSLMIQAGLGVSPIVSHGSAELVDAYARPAIAGDLIGAFALSEPGAGSDALAIATTARNEGDRFLLNGTKMFITNASIADYFIVTTYTDREARSKGMTLVVVPADSEGLSVRTLKKHGNWSADTGEVVLANVEIPAANVLGDVGGGYGILRSSLEAGRITHAARSLGVARAAFDDAVAYVGQREAFGRRLSDFQTMKFRLARMAVDLESARLHVESAAQRMVAGEPVRTESSMAKLVAADVAVRVTAEAMHALGGYGYMREFAVERYHRDARLFPISEGTNDIQLQVISQAIGLGS